MQKPYFTRIALAVLIGAVLSLAGSACDPGSTIVSASIYVDDPPPPRLIVERPLPPGTTAVWIPGQWRWNGYRYVWLPGYWELNPIGVWVPGYWEQTPHGWVWVYGYWR